MSSGHTPLFSPTSAMLPAPGLIMSVNSPDSFALCTVVRAGLELQQTHGPIYAMPIDILAYIFHLGTHFDRNNGVEFPILVSHVCKSWRNLALSTPRLWTTIFISSASIAEWVTFPPGPVLPKASAFVIRSQRCPLRIRVELMVPARANLVDQVVSLFVRTLTTATIELIALVHDRVKTLHIETNVNDAVFMATFRLLSLGLPLLEDWRIDFGNADDSFKRRTWSVPNQTFAEFDASGLRRGWLGDGTPQLSMDASLPRLRALCLCGVRATWAHWSIRNLTSLSLSYMSIADRPAMHHLGDVLERNAASLEQLELFAMLPRKWAEDQMPRIILPKLRELRVGYADQNEAIGLFMVLEMPSLKSLALCDVPRTLHYMHQRDLKYRGFDTDIPIDITVPNLAPDSDSDSTILLCTLTRRCRSLMTQIQELELLHVLLDPQARLWADDVFADQDVAAQFLCPLELLLTMHSLKNLVLSGADPAILQSLNQPLIFPAHAPEARKPRIFYCGSQISTLKVLEADYDDLVDFLYNRSEIARDLEHSPLLPVFGRLEFSLELADMHSLQRECRGNNIDLTLLAKKVRCKALPIPAVNANQPAL
ncbi:hypothetical protein PAXRUDRAFT_823003 [Paxillus rubicundulus Ve08.2h10]|uniref:F-box domain-containing protein n=1 Tax=Paxillus rubicundulus Ve08.2h10 TaxID=930991 RepID=A0A0D0DVX9_9AGAM|nr:hypothetical protein PAXRUDRAFT_823003 [Paxillus rubicundulus Ve08.2h10]